MTHGYSVALAQFLEKVSSIELLLFFFNNQLGILKGCFWVLCSIYLCVNPFANSIQSWWLKTEICLLIVLEARSLKSSDQQCCSPSEGSIWKFLLDSPAFDTGDTPWFSVFCLHTAFSVAPTRTYHWLYAHSGNPRWPPQVMNIKLTMPL